ncbi:ATP-binding protein [Spiroplasma endosymbiont of Melieria omissa]|uniref:ATP-binding protein n=1 Tax=Spiroplasma endosymbiont of Melieria omissa TaxID=3139324 RepID=UPI003CCB1F57
MLDNGYIKIQMNSFNAKKISEDVDYENYAESFKELIYRIKNENEVIKFTQLSFITYSSSLDELKNINNKLFTVINQNNMILDKLSYKQQDSLLNLWINYNDKNKINYNEMSTNSIASCFPFLNNNLLDNNGFYLGQTAIGVPCFLDIKIRDKKKRNNNNVFVVGKSGTGKSFNIKKQLNWLYLNKTKIYIIDPEREFLGFSIFYNAKIIDCGNAKTGLINPLQVFHFFDEDETPQQENELKGHIRSLEEWFKLIFSNLNTNDVLIAMLEPV